MTLNLIKAIIKINVKDVPYCTTTTSKVFYLLSKTNVFYVYLLAYTGGTQKSDRRQDLDSNSPPLVDGHGRGRNIRAELWTSSRKGKTLGFT